MNIRIEFSVRCSQCERRETFTDDPIFVEKCSVAQHDAIAYFEQQGWVKLPSGSWTCGRSHAKEA